MDEILARLQQARSVLESSTGFQPSSRTPLSADAQRKRQAKVRSRKEALAG